MNVFENKEIRSRLLTAFPRYYVTHAYEIIIYPPRNSYFCLEGVETDIELKAKILEWLSREASKSISKQSQKYHLAGINFFLETSFTQDQMTEIYTYLGNRCDHEKTLRFIASGYDMNVLRG